MMPPGRRRFALRCSLSSLLALTLLLLTSTASAASAVLGIDLGTEYIKAALVKPGIPLEIVLSKDSKRKEAAAVAFKPSSSAPQDGETAWPERLYGGDALALTARFPGDVYSNLKPLLGVEYGENVEWPARNPAVDILPLERRHTVGFRSKSLPNEEVPFSVEEMLAMQLKNVRENAETMAGKGLEIRDAVVTVPSYYTADQRRAVELAAELAGLNVIALVSDGLAVGINYATSREFPSVSEGAKPEYHMVLDMGAGYTTATVIRFQGRTVKDVGRFNKTVQEVAVMGAGWDKTLGGDALNVLVREDMIKKFLQPSGAKNADVDAAGVKNNGRTMAKLWREAERIRQVLSANTDASTSFEGLHEDVDFRYKLSRADFEDMASEFASRVATPIERALVAANLSMEELDSVILHGGLVRTPFIQKRLEGLAVNAAKLRSSVNADEAAVFGALYKGAGLSPSFRVKEIRDADAAGYAAGIKWVADKKERQQKLFTPTGLVGPAKQLTFKNLEDFSFTLYQQIPTGDDSTDLVDREVSKVRASNLTASVSELVDKHSCRRDNITTRFTVRINPLFGIPEITQGTVSCEVEPEKAGVVDGMKSLFGFGKKSDQQPLTEDESPPEPVEGASATPASSAGESEFPAPASSAEAAPKVPKKKTVTINLSFEIEPRGLPMPSAAELTAMKKRLASFDASDRNRKQREEVFNILEGLTYRVRDLLEDDTFVAASSEEQRSALQAQVSSTSEWLYGEGSTASLAAVKEKLSELKSLVDPIQKRKAEAAKRPEQIRALNEALDSTNRLVGIIKEQIDAALSASASLEAASSTAVESSSSSSSTVATDDFADLEDEIATSTSTTTTPSPTPSSYFSPYTPEDVAEISSIYQTTKSWLAEASAEQDKLSTFEDPVLLSKDLQDRTKKLNDVVSELIARKLKVPPRSSKSKSAKPKTRKSKSKTTTSAEASSSAEADANRPVLEFPDGEGTMNGDGSVVNEGKLQDTLKRQGFKGEIRDEL